MHAQSPPQLFPLTRVRFGPSLPTSSSLCAIQIAQELRFYTLSFLSFTLITSLRSHGTLLSHWQKVYSLPRGFLRIKCRTEGSSFSGQLMLLQRWDGWVEYRQLCYLSMTFFLKNILFVSVSRIDCLSHPRLLRQCIIWERPTGQ